MESQNFFGLAIKRGKSALMKRLRMKFMLMTSKAITMTWPALKFP